MNLGLIGLRGSGKTTIFNALTGRTAAVSSYGGGAAQQNTAIVDVIDLRVDDLVRIYEPKRVSYAKLEVVDFTGLSTGGRKDGMFTGEGAAAIRASDALAVVLRNFADPTASDPSEPRPAVDLEMVESELLLADQILVERRLEKLHAEFSRGKRSPQTEAEERTLQAILETLAEGSPIREMSLSVEESRRISGFRFLTEKPLFAVMNSSEERYPGAKAVLDSVAAHAQVIEFAGAFEMELSRLDPNEAEEFIRDMGLGSSARSRLSRFAYELLGYVSFFTVGPDEVKAWSIRKGATAVDAAGAIHSDLARGFIRAECFSYENLMNYGSEKEIRARGSMRLEGKGYVVEDGDILNIRFSV